MVLLHEKVFLSASPPTHYSFGTWNHGSFPFRSGHSANVNLPPAIARRAKFFSLIKKTEASSKLGDRRTLLLGWQQQELINRRSTITRNSTESIIKLCSVWVIYSEIQSLVDSHVPVSLTKLASRSKSCRKLRYSESRDSVSHASFTFLHSIDFHATESTAQTRSFKNLFYLSDSYKLDSPAGCQPVSVIHMEI